MVTQVVVTPAAAFRAKQCDCGVAAEVITYRRVEWAINSFYPHKSPGMNGIFPAVLQQGQSIVSPYLIRIFRACLAMGCVPAIWHQVKVVFTPKPGRNSYTGPRDFRPISLRLFLLKTIERLVDRYLRDGALALKPLHPNQHAYQVGKSVQTALHQLVVQVEKVLDRREIAVGVFLDIEGAYNCTSFDSLGECRVNSTTVWWIKATLEGCLAMATLNDMCVGVVVSRGCPQGGVLSLFLWCLVDDDFIVRLSMGTILSRIHQ
jgi:hypothetical protein